MKRRRSLSEEDARLWAGVARTAIPLKGKAMPLLAEEPPAPAGPAGAATGTGDVPASPYALPSPAAPARLMQHPIERPTRRKLSRGRLPIEARLDLHEMTQAVAHYALSNFLRRAQSAGLRHVLVITGRGSPGGASAGSRGILRRVVPHWFATPEFISLVSGFEPAERHHGGDGAFYVRVRRR
ncbi:Smr/MutS family protein [Mangrovicella endophytica]|uniref:Smr/MutS family protein n=1 Tax=Mangrovicella endophytica TaxID=2066697 RepID=UPI000C9DD878|nr:Smr/MutS family protein [Mangrovicella endophytica]